ncbi:hypothetical protein AC578_1561 [Pseudocercospora eumusae]|uniref:Uncharacterized protein n=1 Tax=Pseudocercospora eumusae TaxID=321146 RepID=A0A139HLU0_9PEZI|nr:hypothetical protein AC578_1561 [Pseudocercospora eumusae]
MPAGPSRNETQNRGGMHLNREITTVDDILPALFQLQQDLAGPTTRVNLATYGYDPLDDPAMECGLLHWRTCVGLNFDVLTNKAKLQVSSLGRGKTLRKE